MTDQEVFNELNSLPISIHGLYKNKINGSYYANLSGDLHRVIFTTEYEKSRGSDTCFKKVEFIEFEYASHLVNESDLTRIDR